MTQERPDDAWSIEVANRMATTPESGAEKPRLVVTAHGPGTWLAPLVFFSVLGFLVATAILAAAGARPPYRSLAFVRDFSPVTLQWRFTIDRAREKMHRVYPAIQS
jgi:hypothetical protein